jgi:hypothetical protein
MAVPMAVSMIIVVVIVSVALAVVLVLTIVMPIIVPVLFVHFVTAKMLLPAHVPTPIGSLVPLRNRPPVTEVWI